MISNPVRNQVFERVIALATQSNYLEMSRPESGAFIDELFRNPTVGGVLRASLPEGKIRTYIKDSLLKSYSRKMEKHGDDYTVALQKRWPNIETLKSNAKFKTAVCCCDDQPIIVSWSSFHHYENGLRKLLEFVTSRYVHADGLKAPLLALAIKAPLGRVNEGERKMCEKALTHISVIPIWW